MADSALAEDLKQEGNVHFKNGNFLKAAGLYTRAIKADPENVLLYRYLYFQHTLFIRIFTVIVVRLCYDCPK